jgi:D-alanine-D-alanine ligase
MNIGIVYDLFEDYPWRDGDPPDADAENEPLETLVVIEEAIRLLGHHPIRLGSPLTLGQRLKEDQVDVAINIAEAAHSRNREAYAPILLEMAGIPFLGTDALGLSVSLDKAWTKDLVATSGVPTPPYRCYADVSQIKEDDLPGPFPLLVKPRYEGSSKGITRDSRVHSMASLEEQVAKCLFLYRQDALVESFVEGSEFTVAVVGSNPIRTLPSIQRAVDTDSGIGLHALDRRGYDGQSDGYHLPGELSPELDDLLQKLALASFEKLECRDFARVDFRVDKGGNPWFLEINPLPTFAPDGTLAIQAELENRPYVEVLATIFGEALDRVTKTRAEAGGTR